VLSAADHIASVIGDDAIPFDVFMSLALYGPGGFYTASELVHHGAGRRSDFLTSPEVGPLFGHVLSRFLDAQWREQGRPDSFVVIEHGAGPGTLARGVFAANPDCASALRYHTVEISDRQRALHPDEVVAHASPPVDVQANVVIANELLDNLPFRMFVYDNGWREAWVTRARDGKFNEVLRLPRDEDSALVNQFPPADLGARLPIQRAAGDWLRGVLAASPNARVVVFDYARERTWDVVALKWRDWLRTYRGHERGSHYLSDVGQQDITVDVMIDQLALVAPPLSVRTQSQFLQLWGIDDLVAEGDAYWAAKASNPDLRAMLMRSRSSEAAALCDPAGLGGFSVIEWG
jgi:SAM-dependent MidA family methyltransferase